MATQTSEPATARDRFAEAALDLFLEHGFAGTSLQMIGDRLGVSKAAVYYHFKSKDELLAAVITPAFDRLEEVLTEAESVHAESTRRKKALSLYIDYLIGHRRVAAWLSRDGAALGNPAVWEPAQRLTGRIDAMITSSSPDAQALVWGSAITQALTGAVLAPTELSDDELRTELHEIGEFLTRGYRAASRRQDSFVTSQE
ncbi:MAG: helix-turn-helix domain-containing protein [Aeromicrobium sp.]|uniref:TetR/AcrR family transcriptional regulator n=1 Tax=Aeromicrobium sp. TaxID=1871063 RepID=UPI003C4DD578